MLLIGASASGKSDLALRLIDRGAELIADDRTAIRRDGARLVAHAPPAIAGQLEVRGIGIVAVPHVAAAPIALVAILDEPVERMPSDDASWSHGGVAVRAIRVAALEPSAPIKLELALRRAIGEERA